MMLAQNRTWNTERNRTAMLRASDEAAKDRLDNATDSLYKKLISYEAYLDERSRIDVEREREQTAIDMLELPLLDLLSWEVSHLLFRSMHPSSGIYEQPHRHVHEICGHEDECPWPYRNEPCQATEHWDKRCDKCSSAWWEKYGKAENEEYLRNNPQPKWIHDHKDDSQLEGVSKCSHTTCRNFGKQYNGYETWNGGN